MVCNCSSKSKCKTKKCDCAKLNDQCDSDCDCSIKLCENRSKVSLKKDLIGLCSQINAQITIKVTDARKKVLSYRDGVDIYTGQTADEILKPHVDHVIETQMLAYAAATATGSILKSNMIDPLKESINQNYNYNVTSATINLSKGACIKSFLTDGIYSGMPLRVVVLGKYCEKYINPISNAMLESFNNVDENIRSARVTDNFVTGNFEFEKINDELSNLVNKMDLDINDNHRILRSSNKREE